MGITLTNVGSIVNKIYTPRGSHFQDLGLRPRSRNDFPLGCKFHLRFRLRSSMTYCLTEKVKKRVIFMSNFFLLFCKATAIKNEETQTIKF